MAKPKKIKVFYSWQSDSPKATNQNAIRNSIKKAIRSLKKLNPELNISHDEATRDTPGSPNIALTILDKISNADIFIADITTITSSRAAKASPNPNVVFELGYAVSQLGWDRVILVFNTKYGKFPKDVPFDFVQHRIGHYALLESEVSPSNKEPLNNLIYDALKTVIDKNPKRPSDIKVIPPHVLEHEHDVESMNWIMSSLHLPSIQDHISRMPHYLSDKATWFLDGFCEIQSNKLFSLYDTLLGIEVDNIANAHRKILIHLNRYHATPGDFVFTNPLDLPLAGDAEAAWNDIESAINVIGGSIEKILNRLRENYKEVKIYRTSEKALATYLKYNSTSKQKKKSKKSKKQ